MRQQRLFEDERDERDEMYTKKVEAPLYAPKNKKPHVMELCDTMKRNELIRDIENAEGITDEERGFLKLAASRHLSFNYSKIADYYSHSNIEMQGLMERSALVIIDFDKAIEYGFVHLTKETYEQYIEEKMKNK